MAAHSSVELTFKVKVNENTSKTQKEIVNQARYEDGWNPSSGKDPSAPTNEVVHRTETIINPKTDGVMVEKTAEPVRNSRVAAGDKITYTLKAVNTGEAAAAFVRIRDYVPAHTTFESVDSGNGAFIEDGNYVEWIVKDLAVGVDKAQTVSFTVTVDDDEDVANGTLIKNVALFEATKDDPGDPGDIPDDPGQDGGTTTHTTGEDPTPASLLVQKDSNPAPGSFVNNGSEIVYSLKVTNTGGSATSNACVTDAVPAGTTYKANSASGAGSFTYNEKERRLEWTGISLDSEKSTTLSFTVTVDDDTTGTVTNQARYQIGWDPASGSEPVNYSNAVSHLLQTPPPPPPTGDTVTTYKTAEPANNSVVEGGQDITYTLKAVNTGASTAPFVRIRDYVPAHTTFKSVDSGNGAYISSGGYVEWIVKNLGVGEDNAQTVSFTVTVDKDVVKGINITNTVLSESSKDDPGKPGDNPKDPKDTGGSTIHKTDDTPTDARLEVAKGADPEPGLLVQHGSEIAYSLKVTNVGEKATDNACVTDAVPAGTTYKAGSASEEGTFTYNEKAGRLEWTGISLAKGESKTLTFTVTVNDDATGTVENQAKFQIDWDSSTGKDPEGTTNKVKHPIEPPDPIIPATEVTVRKTADPAGGYVEPGTDITYTLTAVNSGDTTASYVRIRDYVPAYTTFKSMVDGDGVGTYVEDGNYVEWIVKDLAVGEENAKTVKFTVTVDAKPPKKAKIKNVALYDVTDDDPGDPGDNPDDPQTPTVPTKHTTDKDDPVGALLSVEKKANPAAGKEVSPGQEIEYSLVFTNTGDKATDNAGAVDYIPAGTTYVEGSCEADGGRYNAEKGRVEWHSIHLDANGGTTTVKFKVRVNDNATGKVKNNALFNKTGGWDQNDPDPSDSTNIVVHPVRDTPDDKTGYQLTVYKSSDPASGNYVKKGGTITYTFTAKNTGSEKVPYTRIRDYVPTGTTFASVADGGVFVSTGGYVEWVLKDIAANSEKSVSYTVTVNQDAQTYIEDTALYDTPKEDPGEPGKTGDDPKKETNKTEQTTDDTKPVPALIDMEKQSNPPAGTAVGAGSEIVYTLVFKNNGGLETKEAGARDYIPKGTAYVEGSATGGGVYNAATNCVEWTGVSVPAQGTTAVSFTVKVVSDAWNILGDGGVVANQALFANGWKGGTDPGNSSNIVEHPQGGKGDTPDPGKMTVYKTANPKSGSYAAKGSKITYSLEAKNTDAYTMHYVRVRDYIPTGTTYVSVADGGVYKETADGRAYVEWVLTDIAPNESKKVSYTVEINDDAPTFVENVALYDVHDKDPGKPGETGDDPKRDSNTVVHSTDPDVPVPAILELEKSADPAPGTAVDAGGVITYSLTFRNNGGTDAKHAGARDYIPAGTAYVEDSASDGGTYDATRNCVDWTDIVVPKQSSKTVTFQVRVSKDAKTDIENQALFADGFSGGDDPDGTSNITVNPVNPYDASLSLVKESNVGSETEVHAGDVITYTLTLKNAGSTSTDTAGVRDYVPVGTTYVDGSADESGGVYDESRRCVDWTNVHVEAEGQTVLSFAVRVNDDIAEEEIKNVGLFSDDWDGKADPTDTSNTVRNITDLGDGTASPIADNAAADPKSPTYGDSVSTGEMALIAALAALMAVLLMMFGVAKVRRDRAMQMAGAGAGVGAGAGRAMGATGVGAGRPAGTTMTPGRPTRQATAPNRPTRRPTRR